MSKNRIVVSFKGKYKSIVKLNVGSLNQINTTAATSGAGETVYPSGEPEFTHGV
jgi:hypothetical protein